MNYLKLFEEFEEGKFNLRDLERAIMTKKKIYATIVKDLPDNDPDEPLEIVDLDEDTGEVTIMKDGNPYYVDSKNIDRIG
jgi:hypothetical protein